MRVDVHAFVGGDFRVSIDDGTGFFFDVASYRLRRHAESHARRIRDALTWKPPAVEPITCAACKSGPRNTHRGRLCLCASVDAKLRAQAWEITELLDLVKQKNTQLDALHFVWCSGACDGGTHRYGGELTEEIVVEAERNTRRLRERWENVKAKRAP